MPYRVVHYGTGFVGRHALRGILSHPELELAGLVVHSDDKVGKDAGELVGLDPVGVVATQDIDDAIALGADAFSYMATTQGRLRDATGELGRILESGTNVVTSSFGALIHPGTARQDVLERLEASAQKGGTTLLSTGIDPGFFSDFVPVILSGCSQRIDSIRIYELAIYESGGQSDEVAFDIFGFGKPLDPPPPIIDPAGLRNWSGVVTAIAEQLGVALDGIETSYELLPADEGFDYQGRRIESGTIAGVRFEIAGQVDGATKVAVEHVTRTKEDQAPDWPRGLAGDAYRVVVDGSPRLDCEFNFREGDDHLAGGFNITAMRVVNAIPLVCGHQPGVISTFDLPPVTGRGRFAL
jgi:4-hydroxy-tetrahydrodipicolinate reductase